MEPAKFYRHVFDAIAPAYDRLSTYAAAGERLTAAAEVRPGDAVCDVAAGTGAVAVPVLRAIQPGGRVAVVDLSAGMLAQAQEAVGDLPGASYHLAEAGNLPFPDASFDCVTCGLALPFFPDMRAAVREAQRIMRTGGRYAVSVFTEEPVRPALPLFTARLRRYLPPAATLPAQNDEVGRAGRMAALLGEVGLAPVLDRVETWKIVFSSLGEWWDAVIASTPGAEIARLTPEARSALEVEHLAELRPLLRADGLHCEVSVRFVVAERAPRGVR